MKRFLSWMRLAVFLPAVVWAANAADDRTREQLQVLAQRTTHFATNYIVHNWWPGRSWPADLLEEQKRLFAELRTASADRASLVSLLDHPDPKVRTLALGALFIREDAHDLPAISRLAADQSATFPELRESFNSMLGPRPLEELESPQSVGQVASAMLRFYLDAAEGEGQSRSGTVADAFAAYWMDHGNRDRCASWFLVKMRRATRETSPLQSEYQPDIRRVLAEIDALPPVERAWTMLYVRQNVFLSDPDELVPDATLVDGLKKIDAGSLVKFLQRQPVSDDPDIRPPDPGERFGAQPTTAMARFILDNARDLLRPTDADAVQVAASGDRTARVAAAAELRALQAPVEAAASIKAEIDRIPLRGFEGQREQAVLATTLWRMRGASEAPYLANWFYFALPLAQDNMAHGPRDFLRAVQKEARPDTPILLSAIVGDARFTRTDWASLVEIFKQVNGTRPTPLVTSEVLYDYQPRSERPDQLETLMSWRSLLREHFGQPPFPSSAAPLAAAKKLSSPVWNVESGQANAGFAVALVVSADGRLLATLNQQKRLVTVWSVDDGKLVWQKTSRVGSAWETIAFSPESPRHLLLFSNGRGSSQEIDLASRAAVRRLAEITIEGNGEFDRSLTHYGFAVGSIAVKTGAELWRSAKDRPGAGAQVALAADGQLLAVGGGNWPRLVRIFHALDGRPLRDLTEFSGDIAGLAFTPDGALLAVASHGDGVRLWNVAAGKIQLSLACSIGEPIGTNMPCLSLSPDGRRLAVVFALPKAASPDGIPGFAIDVFTVATGELNCEVPINRNEGIGALAFSPDGKWLYTAGRRLAAWLLE